MSQARLLLTIAWAAFWQWYPSDRLKESEKWKINAHVYLILLPFHFSPWWTENGSACTKHICPYGATCSEKNGEAVCECPECPSDYDPVCGTNAVSYQNECRL